MSPRHRLAAAWLIAPLLLAITIALNPLSRPTYLMGDFRAFYCAGVAIAHHADPYREEPLRSCEATAGPPSEPAFLKPVALPAPLPPYALAAFGPLALFPFPVAAALYGLALIAAMAVAVLLLRRLTGASSAVLNVAFAAITATVTLYIGQPVPFVLAALAGAALLVRDGRWWAAAACAACAAIEPHVALAPLAAMAVAFPRVRLPLLVAGTLLMALGVAALGVAGWVEYVRDVLPAHALANAFEWQYSLTSLLTSAGVDAPAAIRAGELMFGTMVVLGIAVALRLRATFGDPAAIVLIPPAFALFGGVHVHVQQMAVAIPALLYVAARAPRVRAVCAQGVMLLMIPWNVVGAGLLAGAAPVLTGTFGALALGRRAGLAFTALGACLVLSVVVLAALGLGPATVTPVTHAFPPDALAELSWGEFSRQALMRPSVMMQLLRIPALAGLGCGLAAIVWAAFAPAAVAAPSRAPAAVAPAT